MSVVHVNSISGITSITTPSSSDVLTIHKSNNAERLRIDSSGRLLLGTTTEGFATYGDQFTIANSGHCGMTIRSGDTSDGNIYFSDGTSGADEVRGFVEYNHNGNTMNLGTNGGWKLRIDSNGHVGLGIAPSDVDSIGKALNIASSTGGAIYLQDTDAPTTKFAAISYNGGTAALQIHAHHSSSYIDLGTNGLQRINIRNDGDVCIGSHTTNYADSPLEVRSTNDGGDVAFRVTNNTTTNGSQTGIIFTTTTSDYTSAAIAHKRNDNALIFYNGQSASAGGFSNATERVRIDSSGCVRVGNTHTQTTSGNTKRIALGGKGSIWGWVSGQINGAVTIADNYYWDGSNNKAIESDYCAYLSLRSGSMRFGNTASSQTGGNNVSGGIHEKFRITNGGYVHAGNTGHGTNKVGGQAITGQDHDPYVKILANNSNHWLAQLRSDHTSGNGVFLRAGNSSSTYTLYATGYDENKPHLTVNGKGAVGVGTGAPDQSSIPGIHIYTTSGDDCRIAFETPTKTNSRIGYFGLSNRFGVDVCNGFEIRDAADGYDTRLQITSGGAVRLYHNNGSVKLATTSWGYQPHGDVIPHGDNTRTLGWSNERWTQLYAASGSINTSDRTEKNTIVDSDLGLSFINKLKPVSYKFNSGVRTHYGLIAQDIEDILPGIGKTTGDFAAFIKTDNPAVLYEESEDTPEGKEVGDVRIPAKITYGLRYSEFIAPLIKAVQELSDKVDALESS